MLTNLIVDLIDLLINNVLFAFQIDLEKTVRKIGFILRSIRYALWSRFLLLDGKEPIIQFCRLRLYLFSCNDILHEFSIGLLKPLIYSLSEMLSLRKLESRVLVKFRCFLVYLFCHRLDRQKHKSLLFSQEIEFIDELSHIQLKLCQVLLAIHGVDKSSDLLLHLFDHGLYLDCLYLLMPGLFDLLLNLSPMLLYRFFGFLINHTADSFTL